jgi:hypothetical protein
MVCSTNVELVPVLKLLSGERKMLIELKSMIVIDIEKRLVLQNPK